MEHLIQSHREFLTKIRKGGLIWEPVGVDNKWIARKITDDEYIAGLQPFIREALQTEPPRKAKIDTTLAKTLTLISSMSSSEIYQIVKSLGLPNI